MKKVWEVLRNETSLKGTDIMKLEREMRDVKRKKMQILIEKLRNETSLKGDEIMKIERRLRK